MTKPKYLAYRTKILGHPWTVYYCQPKYYKKKWDDSSVGMTDEDEKAIYVLNNRVNHEVVAHELTHAYLAEMCVTTASLDTEQMEDVCCDAVGKYGRRIVAQADKIVDAFYVLKARVGQ
jgi:hypothetical protein